ncbi:MAG TPA: histidine kinase [Candidatus Baltobacteraceae bacterium]|nr:histidine kinase [Candidatus Baltobacteraceae bacterium]
MAERGTWLKPVFWYTASWTALVIVWALQIAPDLSHDSRIPWAHAFALSIINFYSSALVAVPIVVVAWRRGFAVSNLFLSIAFYAAAIAFASVVRFVIFVPLLGVVGGTHYSLVDELRIAFIPQFLGMATLLAVVLAIRSVKLSSELSSARLAALQSQIQPHFLFNTLNSVSTLMHTDVDAADEMLAGLCDLLRFTLQTSKRPAIPLGEELTILGQYVELMKRRFPGKLDVRVDVTAELRELPVPPLMLQPLVENVLQHARNESGDVTKILLWAERIGRSVVVHVADNGSGFRANGTRDGIGLQNTRRRLEALYGSGASLALRAAARGTEVLLTLPYESRR